MLTGADPLLSGSTGTEAVSHQGTWNVWVLERLVRERAGSDPARAEELMFLLQSMREFADSAGVLPAGLGELVEESFGDLLAAGVAAAAAHEPPSKPAPEPTPEPTAKPEAEPKPEPRPKRPAKPRRRRAPEPAAAVAAAAGRPRRRLDLTKKVLVLAILVGLIAYVVGGSTFASFSAQTTNPGSSIASGTLTLSDEVNSGTVCNSYGSGSNDNYNAACDKILTLANIAPGVAGGQAKLTIANTGSLDASSFSVFAPYVNATLNQSVSSGATVGTGKSVTSFTVTPLEGPVGSGDAIVLDYGTVTQEFCAGANAPAGSTSITISGGYAAGTTGACPASPTTAGTAFAVGTRVEDTSSDTSAANTDCYDAKTTTPGVTGATKGTDLGFNPTTNNPLCSSALLYVQEQSTVGSNTYSYCWFGRGSPYGDQSPQVEDSNGQCRTPTTMTLASSITAGSSSYSLNVGTLTGNIRSGDTITLAEGGNTMTCTAAQSSWINSGPAVSVNGCSGGASQVFDASAVVEDASAFAALDGTNPSSTISKFDTTHDSSAPITLAPLTANGAANTASTVQLAKKGGTGGVGDTRVFYVGVYLPGSSSQNQNSLQGLMSTFGLTWHIDQ